MFTDEQRFVNTIYEFYYADSYEENIVIFERAIELLKDRLKHEDFSEFDDDDREILEEALSLIKEEQ